MTKKAKSVFGKDLLKRINNSVFEKTMENLPKYRDIELVMTERRRNYLVSQPNYRAKTFFTESLLTIEMTKIQIMMNKPIYLGLSMLDLSKTVMYKFWHDYVKPKHSEKSKTVLFST